VETIALGDVGRIGDRAQTRRGKLLSRRRLQLCRQPARYAPVPIPLREGALAGGAATETGANRFDQQAAAPPPWPC
jgi:hypothetical protein